jgi:hypothetical protein
MVTGRIAARISLAQVSARLLRGFECEWSCESAHDMVATDAYDEQLDRGAQELAGELRALEAANMGEMADAFVLALWNDLITADDFRV